MVAPALIMAGISAAGSIAGGMAANDANKLNADISLMNYYEQQNANRRAQQEAQRQQREGKLGTTDAAGNRTYFVPGVGWVTDLADKQQEIQNASEDEQLRQLSQGARDERVQGRANDRRNREDQSATEADREFRSARRPDQESLRQLMLARGAETRNDAADTAGNTVARAAVRGGGHNAAALMQGARAASDATNARQAGIEAELFAEGEADRRFDKDRTDANGLYDYFRKMSTSGTGNSQVFQPQGPAARSTGVADQGAINALARTAGMDYQQPNDAFARTLGDVGAIGQGYFDRKDSQQYQQDMLDAFGRVGRV